MTIPPQKPVLLSPEALFGKFSPKKEQPAQPVNAQKPASASPQAIAPDAHQLQALPGGKTKTHVSLVDPPEVKAGKGRQLAPGVWYDSSGRTAEGGIVRVLSLDPAKAELVPIFDPSKKALPATALSKDQKLLAAINASFFGAGIIGDIKADTKASSDDHVPALDKITDQRHFIAVTPEGKVVTGKGGLSEQAGASYRHFIGGFPALYTRDQLKRLDQDIGSGEFAKRASYGGADQSSSFSRSFIGITADGRVLLVGAGQGSKRALGVTMAEGARLLRSLGAVEAYILDGGGSTSVYARGVEHARTDGRQVWSYLGVKAK